MFKQLRDWFIVKNYQSEVTTEDTFRGWEPVLLKILIFFNVMLLAFTAVLNFHEIRPMHPHNVHYHSTLHGHRHRYYHHKQPKRAARCQSKLEVKSIATKSPLLEDHLCVHNEYCAQKTPKEFNTYVPID
ncbi:974_t:CDS:2 [Ambispora leptoticha]|uniref:974_t:CDS:1 n=1 Tax=Ambispora leptoticha TaxID=144679 RepID=A0A9N9A894_9GLOM|nr:974_t:CDS:2 [Ambispora leptoticha]